MAMSADTNPHAINWHFERAPINWSAMPGGYAARYDLAPEKIEMIHGKLFWSDEERLMMVGLLLENLGVDKVMQLGDARVWKEAAAALPEGHEGL
jgi:hypothetical protein